MGEFVVNVQRIPVELRHLVPLAVHFGLADDRARERKVRDASREAIEELRAIVAQHDDALDAWLAGPEAKGETFSDEYIMFSAMRMAADFSA